MADTEDKQYLMLTLEDKFGDLVVCLEAEELEREGFRKEMTFVLGLAGNNFKLMGLETPDPGKVGRTHSCSTLSLVSSSNLGSTVCVYCVLTFFPGSGIPTNQPLFSENI